MKVIFLGLGSIGLRHADLLKKKYHYELFALRSDPQKPKNQLGIQELYSWKEVDHVKPEVAFITNPSSLHIKTAMRCAEKGMHLFIEKPLDSQIKNLNRFLDIVDRKKISTYVAYVLRFHPVIQEIRTYAQSGTVYHMRIQTTSHLRSWRPGSNCRESYSARKAMGGGVIYDLSHELDYVYYLLGGAQSLKGQFSRRSHVTVDAEDFADIFVQTPKSPVNIHINFMSHIFQRIIQLDFDKKSIVGDLCRNLILEYREGRIVKRKQFHGNLSDCYARQMDYFLKNLKNRRMMNNVFEASDLLKKIYAFKQGR